MIDIQKEFLAKAFHDIMYGKEGLYGPSTWRDPSTNETFSLMCDFEDSPVKYQDGFLLVCQRIINRLKLEQAINESDSL